MRNQDLINKFNKLVELHVNLDHDTVDEWQELVDEVRAELNKITTGEVRYVNADQYSGNGVVRIEELGRASIDVVSFHDSSLNKIYKQGDTAVFDRLELETHHKYPRIVAEGLL